MTDDLISRKYILDALGIFDCSHAEDPKSIDKFMHGIESAREIVQNAPAPCGRWVNADELNVIFAHEAGAFAKLDDRIRAECFLTAINIVNHYAQEVQDETN